MKKHEDEKAVRTSVSLPKKLYQAAEARARSLGFDGYSDYVRQLIRRDLGLPHKISSVSQKGKSPAGRGRVRK